MAYSTLTRLPGRTGLQSSVSANLIAVPVNTSLLQKRGLATATAAEGVASAEALSETKVSGAPQDGPMREYDIRVQEGRLRDDPYQRGKQDRNVTSKLPCPALPWSKTNANPLRQELSRTSRTSSKH